MKTTFQTMTTDYRQPTSSRIDEHASQLAARYLDGCTNTAELDRARSPPMTGDPMSSLIGIISDGTPDHPNAGLLIVNGAS